MSWGQVVTEFRKASPTTAIELFYFLVLTSLGYIALLRPSSFFGINDIILPEILLLSGGAALLVLISSPLPLLLTKFVKWVNSERAENG